MTDYGTHADGSPVTDTEIQAWVDEAERGYSIPEISRRFGRPTVGDGPGKVVPVRLDPRLDAELTERAEADHTTRSDVIRQALRNYLAKAST